MTIDNNNTEEAYDKNELFNTEQTESNIPWGNDLYPERRGEKYKTSWVGSMLRREELVKIKCENNVYKCVKKSAIVKLMMAALKSSGCEIDIRRHISCEMCDTTVIGGYDPELNQIIVCENVARTKSKVQSVLTHEMIHMFDYCRNNIDFRNIDHIACTEIRAANLAQCSFLTAWLQGSTSIFNMKNTHRNCVKSNALASITTVRKIPKEVAIEAIERVFDKCYEDLEPIGRRVRRKSFDTEKAYMEAPLYGYEL